MEFPLSIIPDSLEGDGTTLQREVIEVGRLSTPEGPTERVKSPQDFKQETVEVEESSEPVVDARADIEPVVTSLELPDVDPDLLESVSHNGGSKDHHGLDSLVESSQDFPMTRIQTTSLESSVPEVPSSYFSSANPRPDKTVPSKLDSSVGLESAPSSLLLEHDPFIVGDSKPILPTSMEIAKTFYVGAVPPSPRFIKEEHSEINPDNAMMLGLSQDSSSSQLSKLNTALGKRRRPRFGKSPLRSRVQTKPDFLQASHSNKKRKVGQSASMEIINLSDDESSEQASLGLSIVVAPVQRRKSLDTRVMSQKPLQPSTPKAVVQYPSTSSSRKKRSFFEAVELPTLQELLKKRSGYHSRVSFHELTGIQSDLSVGVSNRSKKTMTRTASTPHLSHKSSNRDERVPGPSKRLRINNDSGKGKQKAIEDWSDDSPAHSLFFGPLSSLEPSSGGFSFNGQGAILKSGIDDTETRLTPQLPSDSSVLRPGQYASPLLPYSVSTQFSAL